MVKAVVAGAAGGIGQPLSMLLKLSPYVDDLALYDVVNAPGVAADLSHISTKGKLQGYLAKEDGLRGAMTGADIVVIPAGIPRKPGMTRDDLFKINAGIVRDIIEGVAQFCPKAFVLIISNPVNSTVPIAAEVLKKHGVFDAKRLFGVTTLDSVRAETFVTEVAGAGGDPRDAQVPVIGGHSGETIVPLLSKAKPALSVDDSTRDKLVNRIQFGGDEVVKAKDGAGSATLSMAYAGYRFAEAVLKGAKGESAVAPAYVYLDGIDGGAAIKQAVGVDYFAVPIVFGPEGAQRAENPLEGITEYEQGLLKAAIAGLKGNISKGVEFIAA